MADITALILADHNWFREQFAKLDALQAQSPEDRAALEVRGELGAPVPVVEAFVAPEEERVDVSFPQRDGAGDPDGQ